MPVCFSFRSVQTFLHLPHFAVCDWLHMDKNNCNYQPVYVLYDRRQYEDNHKKNKINAIITNDNRCCCCCCCCFLLHAKFVCPTTQNILISSMFVLFLSFLVICRKSSWYKHDTEVDKTSSLSEIWSRHSDVIESPCLPGHVAGLIDKVINVAVPWNSSKIYKATRGNSPQYYSFNCWLLSDDWKKLWTFISVFARWKFDGTGAILIHTRSGIDT